MKQWLAEGCKFLNAKSVDLKTPALFPFKWAGSGEEGAAT